MAAPLRPTLLLIAILGVSMGVPLSAYGYLQHKIGTELEPNLTAQAGHSIEVGAVEASLMGKVRLRNVAIAGTIHVRAIEVELLFSRLLSGDIAINRIYIEQPFARIAVTAKGRAVIRRMLLRTKRARAKRARHRNSTNGASLLQQTHIVGGRLEAIHDTGTLVFNDIAARKHNDRWRLVSQHSRVEVTANGLHASAEFGQSAADIALDTLVPQRILALDGELVLTSDGGRLAFTEATLSYGFGGTDLALTASAIDHRKPADDASTPPLTARAQLAGLQMVRLDVHGTEIPLAIIDGLHLPGVQMSEASGTGSISVTRIDDNAFATQATMTVHAAELNHQRIASQPLRLGGNVQFVGTVSPGHIDVQSSRIRVGELVATGAGEVHWTPQGDVQTASLMVAAPLVACQLALLSVPIQLREHLDGLEMDGRIRANAQFRFDRSAPGRTALTTRISNGCRVEQEATNRNPKLLTQPFDHTFPDGARRRVGYKQPNYVTLRSVPTFVIGAFLSAEDARFYKHNGFDPRQIERSLAINLDRGEVLRGGSTITQQLVKNLFLSHERTVARKLQEAVLTWRVESTLSKRLILERYLNIIELGPGVFGLGPAADFWFEKAVAKLSPLEASFLSALTRSPRTTGTQVLTSGASESLRERINRNLNAMRARGAITRARYQHAIKQPLVFRDR